MGCWRGTLSATKVWLDMVSTRWRQIVHSLYAIKREAWKGWGRGLSFNVVFEKNVFVRRVRCLALLEFLYTFPSPYTLGRRGNAKDDDGDISIHTYIHMQTLVMFQHAENMGYWTGMASGETINGRLCPKQCLSQRSGFFEIGFIAMPQRPPYCWICRLPQIHTTV